MKKNIILMVMSIIMGVSFTFFVLNKEDIYAKEDNLVYAFQTGAYKTLDDAKNELATLPSGIIINEDGLNNIYIAIYQDLDLVNQMLKYYQDNNIYVSLKTINVNKAFRTNLNNYEQIIKSTNVKEVYNNINQNILNLYKESIGI